MRSIRSSLPLLIALLLGLTAAAGPCPAFDVGAKARSILRNALDENRAGNYGRALQLFIDAHEEDADILALDDEGLLRNASQWLEGELTRDDSDFHAHFQMAELKMLQGRPSEALPHYEKVVSLAPGSPLANLAKPLIGDIQSQLPATPGGSSSASSSGSSGSSRGGGGASSAQVRDLQTRVDTLQQQLEKSQQELARVRAELAQERAKPDRSKDYERLRKEFDDYKKQAEVWKRDHLLWLQSLSRGNVSYPR